jgi:AcrR family transcriptional regulator
MARPRSAGFDGQREQILSAASALFAQQGFAGSTMNAVAEACGVSKSTLYHYVRDKQELLAQISSAHVMRLEALVDEVKAESRQMQLSPEAQLALLISRFMQAYALAQNEHRVLTEDVKFLDSRQRAGVLAGQRRVVDAFAAAVTAVRPELAGPGPTSKLPKVLAMLLFGMINWTFTWLRPDGAFSHSELAPIISELFLGGLRALLRDPAAQQPAGAAVAVDRLAIASPRAMPAGPMASKPGVQPPAASVAPAAPAAPAA